MGSFCLWELGGGGGADDFTTDHAASQGQGQLPSSPIPALSISESAELVSFPHCKHNTKQGNNEAAYLDKTCFPAECHYVSLFMLLNSLFQQLAARTTGKRFDCELVS